MITIEEIQNMNPEELAALKKHLSRTLAKRIALRVGVTVAVCTAVHFLVKKFENDSIETETPAE